MKTLREAKIGQKLKVVRLHGEGAIKRRLMDMGIFRKFGLSGKSFIPVLIGTVCHGASGISHADSGQCPSVDVGARLVFH